MSKQNINVSYDDFADVLYLTTREMTYTKNSEDEAGLVLRCDPQTHEPVGATIIDFKEHWAAHSQHLIERLSNFFHISKNEATDVIHSVH